MTWRQNPKVSLWISIGKDPRSAILSTNKADIPALGLCSLLSMLCCRISELGTGLQISCFPQRGLNEIGSHLTGCVLENSRRSRCLSQNGRSVQDWKVLALLSLSPASFTRRTCRYAPLCSISAHSAVAPHNNKNPPTWASLHPACLDGWEKSWSSWKPSIC